MYLLNIYLHANFYIFINYYFSPYPVLESSPSLQVHMMCIATVHTVVSLILLITYVFISKPGFYNICHITDSIKKRIFQIPLTDSIRMENNLKKLKQCEKKIKMLREDEQAEAIMEYRKLSNYFFIFNFREPTT